MLSVDKGYRKRGIGAFCSLFDSSCFAHYLFAASIRARPPFYQRDAGQRCTRGKSRPPQHAIALTPSPSPRYTPHALQSRKGKKNYFTPLPFFTYTTFHSSIRSFASPPHSPRLFPLTPGIIGRTPI